MCYCKKGILVARTHNRVLETNDPTAHAEILAIREASAILKSFDLSDCEIYSTSQPCPMCYSAIHWARIKKLYFGTTKDDVSAIGFDDSFIYDVIKGNAVVQQFDAINIDRDECQGLLNEWIEKPDKKCIEEGI